MVSHPLVTVNILRTRLPIIVVVGPDATTLKHNLSSSSPGSFCLVSLMATLNEEMDAPKAEIDGYTAKLDAATTEAREEMYANLIIAKETRLHDLNQQLQGK